MAGAANGDGENTPEDQGDASGWKHISKLHTCQHCDRIVITHRQVKRRLVSLPHTKSEALQAEADGCPVFMMLTGSWHLIARDGGPGDLLKPFRFLSDMDEIRVLNVVIVVSLKEEVRVEMIPRGPLYIYTKYKIYTNISILFHNIQYFLLN